MTSILWPWCLVGSRHNELHFDLRNKQSILFNSSRPAIF